MKAQGDEEKLQSLRPYMANDSEKTIVNGLNFNNVMVFNEEYVNSYLFEDDSFLENSFKVFLKAYREKVDDPDYKVFNFDCEEAADYCYCLINSSLFWWYWIATSDCWHVSKELNGFMAPFNGNYRRASRLAMDLRQKLEETKVYVGTKQTDYEYKHRECIEEIHAIDTYMHITQWTVQQPDAMHPRTIQRNMLFRFVMEDQMQN